MKTLKYQDEIDQLSSDFTDFKEQTRSSYRWTFDDISDSRNFLPVYKLNPRPDNSKFIGWGLSFFSTKEFAIKRIREIQTTRKNVAKKLGTHVAQGTLIDSDGISNEHQIDGHFTHFEYPQVALEQKFNIICKINE